jgi:cation transport protein ChaC
MQRFSVGPFPPLSDTIRSESLHRVLAAAPDPASIWLFTYGSLMWNPEFAPADTRVGTLDGYHRALNVWTAHARGTPDNPGLALGLAAGTECRGVLYRLNPNRRDGDLTSIWDREMYTGVYRPAWLRVRCAPQGAVTAICFITDTKHPQFAAPTTMDKAAQLIARASGKYGRCRDYLAETLKALRALGIEEPALSEILDRADRLPAPTDLPEP